MSKLSNLVFFGTENFSAPALERLIADGWPILAVVTKPDARGGRGQKLITPKVKEIAQKHKITVLQPEKVTEINGKISELKPSHGVLVAYGKIIPQSTIDLFPGGIVNVHPSLLPRYRGPAPIEAPILNADKETGISLMRLSAGMDEGPVYEQTRVQLDGDEQRPGLYEALASQGAELLADKLPAITEGWLTPRPQIDANASYTKLLKKADGWIDWSQPAEVYERQVRAYLDFPRSRAKLGDNEVVITKSRVAASKDDGQLVMKSQPGWLEILELIAPSGRKMSGADFKRGYQL